MSGGVTLESYAYTLTGNKLTESNATVTTTNGYDNMGRLVKTAEKNNGTGAVTTKIYTYDIGSNRQTATVIIGGAATNNTSYTYDEANRMKTVSEFNVLQCTYSYDANGNRSSATYNATNMTTTYTYNLANMLKTLTNKSGTATLSQYSYVYQLDGNQTSKTDQTGKVTSYVYDGLGRLLSEAEKTGTTITFSLAYQYDASNNRARMTDNTGRITVYSYDADNRLSSTIETAGTTVTRTDYRYDKNGNTLSKMTGVTAPATGTASGSLSDTSGYAELYGYDLLNRMISSNANGVIASYRYRADGLRYSKTVGGVETAHIWDGANIVGDVVNGVVGTTYVRGINLIASKTGGVFTYYLYNGHGDVVQLIMGNYALVKTYDYDSFGNERNPVATDANPFRYCGEYFDRETKTVYLRARYYSPVIGRFTTEDSVWSSTYKLPNGIDVDDSLSLNLYTYGYNNPILNQDPSGHIVGADDLVEIVAGSGMILIVTVGWLMSPVGQDYLNNGGTVLGAIGKTAGEALEGVKGIGNAIGTGIKGFWDWVTGGDKGDNISKVSKKQQKIDAKKSAASDDVKMKDLTKVPDDVIKKLGGEKYTQDAKAKGGKSKSNLYWDKDGNIYSVPNGSNSPELVDRRPDLKKP